MLDRVEIITAGKETTTTTTKNQENRWRLEPFGLTRTIEAFEAEGREREEKQ